VSGRALLVAALALLAASGAAAAPPEDAVRAAEALLDEGRAAEAAEAFRGLLPALEGEPAPNAALAARVRSGLGRALVRTGETYASLQHLEEAVRLRGSSADRLDYAEALVAVARENAARGPTTAAAVVPYLRDAEEAARATAADASVASRRLRVLGEAAYRLGHLDEAVDLWQQARLEAQPLAEARFHLDLLARALYDLGRHAASAEAFHAAGNPKGEASAWAAAKDAERSLGLYAALVRADPEDATLLDDALAAARYVGGQALLATLLADVKAEGPALARLLRARGVLADAAGDRAGALSLLEDAAKADPEAAAPLVEKGRILLADPDATDETVDHAVDAYLEALRRAPENESARSVLWYLAGRDYGDLWRTWPDRRALDRCLRIQRALLDADPSDALAWGNLGNTLRVGGDARAALEAYDRAIRENPYDPAVWSDLGLARSAAGDAPGAVAAFEKSIGLDAGHVAARQNLARALHLSGEDARAREQLGAALATSRALGSGAMLFRFLLDRSWRAGALPEVR
jgi:tetratricopeptide (TPR) repeat protein